MSDCGVCLSYDDSIQSDFMCKRNVKAAKDYKCYECYKPITKGTVHQYASGKCEGDFWTARTCLVCAEIRHAFYCHGEMWGEFWTQMYDYVFPDLTTGCLEKLQTPEAKKELLRRWNEWKFRED